MKRVSLAVLIFIAAFFISFLFSFPREKYVRYQLSQLEKNSGIGVVYDRGKFGFNKMHLYELEISGKGKHLTSLKELKGELRPSSVKLEAFKGEGSLEVVAGKNGLDILFKRFQLVTEGTKFFKQITISGNFTYDPKNRRGGGKQISLDLRESLDPMLKSDIIAEAEIQSDPRNITINLTQIRGEDMTGNGIITITVDEGNIDNSPISGNLRINTGSTPVQIKISGTVGNPTALPAFGSKLRILN